MMVKFCCGLFWFFGVVCPRETAEVHENRVMHDTPVRRKCGGENLFNTPTVEDISLRCQHGNYSFQKRYCKALKKQYEPLLPSQNGWHGRSDVVILHASGIFELKLFFGTKLIPLCIVTLTCL